MYYKCSHSKKKFFFWMSVSVRGTPSFAQGLFLALSSWITPGGVQGSMWVAGFKIKPNNRQDKIPPAPVPQRKYY